MLRLVAILAIAVFHTFQPWFSAAVDPASDWAIAHPWLGSSPVRTVLGCINLLGAYGNDIFFLISGYFLLPRAIENPHQAKKTLRRVALVLASVMLYAVLVLGVSSLWFPIDGIGLDDLGWLLEGLEFIWVYLAVVLVTPVLALVARRAPHRRGMALAAILATLTVNAYIAFLSPGDADRGLLEWRKLMSALTYLMAYIAGALMARSRGDEKSGGRKLACAMGICLLLEAALAFSNRPDLLAATSFKSTSALSFMLAVASARFATSQSEEKRVHPLTRYANSILGFYIVQSMTSGWWRPLFEDLTFAAATYGFCFLVICGTLLSLALIVGVVLFDQALRIRLLKALRLA